MRIRNIDKVPVIFTRQGDCEKLIALALRSAMAEGAEQMQLILRTIESNMDQLSDRALTEIIREIDESEYKAKNGQIMLTICSYVLREQQRRRQ